MVWLGGQGLRKTMIGKLVTKKFEWKDPFKWGYSVKTLCLVECSPNGDISREGF